MNSRNVNVNNSKTLTPAITVSGNIFMAKGVRWSPKGVCYQPTDNVDPLSDDNLAAITELLNPDTKYGLLNLGINCIRVYQVDPAASHDKVMDLLSKNGIYVLVGTVNSTTAIPSNTTSLPANTVARVKAVADAFHKYDNVLGFSISNELLDSNDQTNYGLVGIVKQLKQALQSHMKAHSYRAIPIGCCTRDDPSFTYPATQAYVCGTAEQRMDFIGYNCYRWIVDNGASPPAGALNAYYDLYHHFKDFPVPVMLTEIGAQCVNGRGWSQIPYIFGKQNVSSTPPHSKSANMADAISGCFAFQYYQHTNNFGLVEPNHSLNPSPVTTSNGINGAGGYIELQQAYNAITAFSGNANGAPDIQCSSLTGNPYAGNCSSGGLATAITVMLTNDISNPTRKITFNYSLQEKPSENDWITAVTIEPNGESRQFTFPQGTQTISMVYEVSPQWFQGCQLRGANLLSIKNGDTIHGQWIAPNGNGTCTVE